MGKKYFLLVFLVCFSSVMGFAFDYWWLDVLVDGYKLDDKKEPSTQRAYFFKDLRSFQEATGFPRGVANDPLATSFYWDPNPDWRNYPDYRYYGTIYSTMRREGFSYAFILTSNGFARFIQRRFWSYTLFMLRNGVEYYTSANRYDNPIRF